MLAAGSASAQSNPTLPTTDVDNQMIIVSASRTGVGVRADLLGGSATVLDAQSLDERQTRNLSDVLRDVPGVAVNGIAGLTQVRIRGTESNHVLVLIDGIKASDPYDGEFDFGTLVADQSARVEILRGQQSALYGSDAIGGVIQYITLTGREAPGIRLRIEGGSFGTVNGSARAAGVAGDLDYALSISSVTTDGVPAARGGTRDVGTDNYATSLKSSWTPNDDFKLTAVGRYSHTRGQFDNSNNDPASPLFGYTVDSPGSYYKNDAFYALLRGELALLHHRWTHAITGQITDATRDGYNLNSRNYGDHGQRLKGSYDTTFSLDSARAKQTMTFALDVESERFRNTTPGGFAFTGFRSVRNIGLVGQYRLVADQRLAFDASVRRDLNNRFADTTTYRVEGSYAFPTGTRLRGATGSGVKNPGFFDLFGYVDGRYIGNPNLRPESSDGWEAGVEQSLFVNRVTLGATYFDSTLHDQIFVTFPPPDFVALPGNRTTVSTQQGVEAFATARLGREWRLDLAYTYLHARQDGAEAVRRPPHIASLNLAWRAKSDRAGAGMTVRYNGAQKDFAYTDPSFVPLTVGLKAYTLVNVDADLRLTRALSAFARIENLFDERYEQVFSFAAEGRGGYAGVRAKF